MTYACGLMCANVWIMQKKKKLFTDDSTTFLRRDKISEIHKTMTLDLGKLNEWFELIGSSKY